MRTSILKAASCVVATAVVAVAFGTAPSVMASHEPPTQGPRTPVVQIEDGPIRGFINEGVQTFLGVRYAAPPVGQLRWRPPQSPAEWNRPINTTAFGNTCPQTDPLGVFARPSDTEDCLFLNVFASSDSKRLDSDDKKPVMVWIHGGGNRLGSSNEYDGTSLARDGGVVVVTFNRRLGVFGWLSHPALDTKRRASGNYGFLDMVFALQWMEQNIEKFGGDPNNVTIFGESGGGVDVQALMVSPLSEGLFHRGIIQSGSYQFDQPDLETAQAEGQEFAEAVGCVDQSASCLRALSVQEIHSMAGDVGTEDIIVDGEIIPQTFREAFTSGEFNHVPVISGATRDENTFFVGLTELETGVVLTADQYPDQIEARFGDNAAAVLTQYPLSNYNSASEALAAAQSDSSFICGTHIFNQWVTPFIPVYAYEFADQTAPSYAPLASFPYGAAHTFEIPYLFLGYHGATGTPQPLNEAQQSLSDDMVSYWTTFAEKGNPNSDEAPFWPEFTEERERYQVLILPEPHPTSRFAERHNCDFWADLQ
jgi:para-nitrobenzyl esterase